MTERCTGCGHNFYHDQPIRDGLCKYCIEEEELVSPVYEDHTVRRVYHPQELNYPGGIKQLATDLTRMRYDTLQQFFEEMTKNLLKDSWADDGRGRKKLAEALSRVAGEVAQAWDICRGYMTDV